MSPTTEPQVSTGLAGRGWLQPMVLRVAVLAIASGYGQFGLTAVLGDVALAFGEATSSETLEVGLRATTLGVGLAVIRLAAIGALPLTALADRYGRRNTTLGFAAAGLALTVAAAASPSYWWLVAIAASARPLLSATNALTVVVAAEETTSTDRAKALGLVQAAYALGAGIVSIIHGFAGDTLGFRGVFLLSAVPLVGLPLLARSFEESPLFAAHRDGVVRRPAFGMVVPALRRRLALVALLALAMALVTGPVFTYLFVHGEVVLGASGAFMAGLVVAAGPIGLGGLLAGRYAADRFGRRVTAGASMAATAVVATVTYTGTITALVVGYLATAALAGAFGPSGGALLNEVFPTEARATASGWVAAAGVAGAVGGLAAFGWLGDVTGSFGTAAAVLWLPVVPVAALYAFLPETRGAELDTELLPLP